MAGGGGGWAFGFLASAPHLPYYSYYLTHFFKYIVEGCEERRHKLILPFKIIFDN
jgi:hypothetical protein